MRNAKKGIVALSALTIAASAAMVSVGAVTAQDDELVVGVSWNNFQEERWARLDEPAIQAALDEAGASYISTDAGSSAEQQLADVEQLITQGADALIILAQDGTAILPAVQSAIDQGIPVVAYDRLIENPEALYITFDNFGVGVAQAETVFGIQPSGNYAIIKGNQADANADFLRAGMETVIGDAVANGDITIVCETYTDNWDPELAKGHMEQCLTANDNAIDAVLAQNDGMAGGVISALADQGLAGSVPVSGQDGDVAALNRVALGTQSVSVTKDARDLGAAAGAAAAALAGGTAAADIEGAVQFETPGGNTLSSLFLAPVPVTQGNLMYALDAGLIDAETLCQNVEAGSVEGC